MDHQLLLNLMWARLLPQVTDGSKCSHGILDTSCDMPYTFDIFSCSLQLADHFNLLCMLMLHGLTLLQSLSVSDSALVYMHARLAKLFWVFRLMLKDLGGVCRF